MNAGRGRGAAHVLLVLIIYLAFAVVATWPLAAKASDRFFGEATPSLNAWAMGWVQHQLARDPFHLFDGNIFHPYRATLAFSEHLFVQALLAAPVTMVTGNLVLAHNLVALLSLGLAGLGMFLLVQELTGDRVAAFGAGLLYAFHTWNVNELIRIQILSNQYFPFLLLALLRFFRRPAWRSAMLAGALYLLQSLSCMYWAAYLPLLLAPTVVVLWARHRQRVKALFPLAVSLGAAAAVSGLFLLPYIQTTRELGFRRLEALPVGIERYFNVLPGNLLYGGFLGIALPNQNAAHFLGFVGLGLAGWGVIRGRWSEGYAFLRIHLAILVASGFLLSLGPTISWGETVLAPGPYALLMNLVPGFRNVRYPERFSLFLVLGLAPLVGAGLARLRASIGKTVALAAGVVIFLEHLSIPLALVPIPTGAEIPSIYRWIANEPGVKVTAEVPTARFLLERFDALPMYFSTVHWKRTLTAFSGYFPPTYTFTKWRLFHFPSRESVAFLARFGVDTVVVCPENGRAPVWAGQSPWWDAVGPFPEGHMALRLKDVADVDFPPPPLDAAQYIEIDRQGFEVQASRPGAALAMDGNEETEWTTEDPQGKGDFYRIRLPLPEPVARISMSVRGLNCFPMHFKVMGEVAPEEWIALDFDEALARDRFVSCLLHRPRSAVFVVDLEPREVRSVRLRITENDSFRMRWTISEVRLFRRRDQASTPVPVSLFTGEGVPSP